MTQTAGGYEQTGGPHMKDTSGGYEGSGGPKMAHTAGGFEGTGTSKPAQSEGVGEYKGSGMRPRYPKGKEKQSSYFKTNSRDGEKGAM